jgi:hypothetical protein
VPCDVYKLAHNANFLICSELFTIGKTTISLVLHEFVKVVNITLRNLISWPMRAKLNVVMESFSYNVGC